MEHKDFPLIEALPLLGYSRYRYLQPVDLPSYEYNQTSPAHKGVYKNAIDIAVPDPREKLTVVRAPISGTIEYLVMHNTTWGPVAEFRDKLNFVNIRPNRGSTEFVEVAHLAPLVDENGKVNELKVGDRVEAGQPIAVVGLNGWITTNKNGEPDSHVHIMVGQWKNRVRRKFNSLKIRWI